MKNLSNLGVNEMTSSEMQRTNGGLGATLACLVLSIAIELCDVYDQTVIMNENGFDPNHVGGATR